MLLVAGVPAAAAAAGIDVPNPVAVALRASMRTARVPEGAPACDPACPTPGERRTTPASTPRPTEPPRAEGNVTSIVAACAPRGADPVFAVTGDLKTHGDFVSAAAAGDTLALPFGSYDLASAGGARSLCAALGVQRAAVVASQPAAPRDRDRDPGRSDASRSPKPRASRTPQSPRRSEPSRPAPAQNQPRPKRSR